MRTRIFFPVNNTDYLLVPNYRILSSHGISRTVTDFLFFFSCPELSNYRILSFLSRDLSFVPRLVLGPTDRREVIFEFSNFCLPWLSVILRVIIRNNSQIRKFVTKIIPRFSVWLKRNNSQIRKFVTRKIIPCEKPPWCFIRTPDGTPRIIYSLYI